MRHRIVEIGSFDAVGLRTECPGGDTNSIGQLWDDFFGKDCREVAGSQGIVGVSWGDGTGGFSYMAAHKLPAGSGHAAAAAAQYESRAVPGGKYVGVQWAGKGGPEMSSAFMDIFQRVIPEVGLQVHPEGCCIEDYPNEGAYDEATGTLRAELLVRVQ